VSARDDVLEHNLARLFERAWRPPRPSGEFRARLGREFADRAGRYARSRGRLLPAWVAAAAALLVLGLAWRLLSAPAPPQRVDLAAILARGEVAWRSDGAWQALPAEHGVADLGPRAAPLEVWTPPSAAARLAWALGELELLPEGSATLARGAAGESLWLAQGALQAHAQGGTLALGAADGTLALEAGRARLAHVAGGLEVSLASGRARLGDGPSERAVEAPGRWLLRAGRVVEPPAEPELRTAVEERAASETVPAPEQAAREVVLRGRVRAPDGFEADGSPRWRAQAAYRVLLLRAVPLPMASMPEEPAVREGDGRFAVPPLEPGDYTLFVLAPGHAVWRSQPMQLGLAPQDPAQVPELDVRLDVGLTLRGTLRDKSGAPLAGAMVLSESDAAVGVLPLDVEAMGEFDWVRFAQSDADGAWQLEHVASGTQVLRASGGGAAVAWIDDLEVAGVLPLAGLDLVLGEAGAIEGRVLDADGAPRTGAVVLASVSDFSRQRPALSYAAAEVDGEGRYTIEGLPGGMLAVLLFAQGMQTADSAPDLRLVSLREGGRRTVDFLAQRARARLSGRLLDESGAPLGGRAIWIEADARGGRPASMLSDATDDEGRFEFDDLAPGELDVYVAGLRPTELALVERLALAEGEELERDIRAGSQRVAGRVLAAADGAPVSGALVVLLEGPDGRFAGKAMSDAAGHFALPHVRAGLYELCVLPARGPVGELALPELAVAAGVGVEGLELRLPRGGGIEFAVRDEDGAPVAGALLRLVSPAGVERWCEEELASDAAGRIAVEGLTAGRWRVHASAAGFAEAGIEVEVRPAERATAGLVLRRSP
jgi:hypothetical protein